MSDGFEPILGMYSIIIGLGVSKLLEGVKNQIAFGQKLRGNGLYATMLVIGLAVHVTSWLSLWSLRNVETWGVWSFLLIMTVPLVMYLYSAVAVPEDESSPNMNDYYLLNASKMHALLIMAIGCNAFADLLLLGRPPDVAVTVVRFVVLALMFTCAVNPAAVRLHRIILPTIALGSALLVPFMEFPIK